ncbi:hypothetical protein NEUTE1DRAFT_104678 [Neurospora tetrasperma FGSC 2508]|uniref:Uncharacterized protein n=1 Tax=Neurospora tetrasperma (strain FGSC 2508 / ATCC MYA-4615 / P0657) TaxID=510951 RepID=F8N2H1_NEUT8|nr:uncharacterized protein NEUTE1DRAFT_104678 [Neurospora tetrasperma FGSC 2508]EGO51643.1 hypothetical protein NEUTE1DRAFT_104678 [Neurospora tetrasperma FGSC 2508]
MRPLLVYTSFSLSQRLRTPRNKSAGHPIHPTPTFPVSFNPSVTVTVTIAHPLVVPIPLPKPLPPPTRPQNFLLPSAYIPPPPPPPNPNTT